MEQQDKPASTSPFTEQVPAHQLPQQKQKQQQQQQLHFDQRDTSASLPFPISPSHLQEDDLLSTSEPTLRFPRPVGNHHLAKWISTSDPDIMRITSEPTEETGLSNSSYELISGVDDSESWSQDGTENECISESVSSLDPRHPDDVQSLGDTEHVSTDDEFTPLINEAAGRITPLALTPEVPDDSGSEEEEEEGEEEEAASRSSLDYTQQSLKTPSMNTPEASNVYERPPSTHPTLEWLYGVYIESRDFGMNRLTRFRRDLHDGNINRTSWFLLWLLQLGILALVIRSVSGPAGSWNAAVNNSTSHVPPVTTTATHAPQMHTSTAFTSAPRPATTYHIPTGQVLRYEASVKEWIVGPKKPEVSFSKQAADAFLARIPEDVKEAWISNGCVVLTAARDGKQIIDTTVKPVRDGLLIRIPQSEAHGAVDLTLEATCKPGVKKVARVEFVKGTLKEVYEWTTHVIKDSIVPLVERGLFEIEYNVGPVIEYHVGTVAKHLLDELKGVFEPAADSLRRYRQDVFRLPNKDEVDAFKDGLSNLVQGMSNKAHCYAHGVSSYAHGMSDFARSRFDSLRDQITRRGFGGFSSIQQRANDLVHDTQTTLHLNLLNAQISAKLSWLSLLGKKQEHDEYLRKATAFLEKKVAAARERRSPKAEKPSRLRWWS
jgi:hypothetical protein